MLRRRSSACDPTFRESLSPMSANRAKVSLSPLYILVVEDHRDTRDVFGIFLDSLGFRYDLAPDAGTALAKARTSKFDVLITDVQLPGRDGWKLIHDLQSGGHLPPLVISMSAGNDHVQSARSRAVGCHAHLVKPFKCLELETLLQSAAQVETMR